MALKIKAIPLKLFIDAYSKAILGIEPPRYLHRKWITKEEIERQRKEGIWR